MLVYINFPVFRFPKFDYAQRLNSPSNRLLALAHMHAAFTKRPVSLVRLKAMVSASDHFFPFSCSSLTLCAISHQSLT